MRFSVLSVFSRGARDRCRLELIGRQESWLRYRGLRSRRPWPNSLWFCCRSESGSTARAPSSRVFPDQEVLAAKSALPGGHEHLRRRWPPRSGRPRRTAPWLNRRADWAKHTGGRAEYLKGVTRRAGLVRCGEMFLLPFPTSGSRSPLELPCERGLLAGIPRSAHQEGSGAMTLRKLRGIPRLGLEGFPNSLRVSAWRFATSLVLRLVSKRDGTCRGFECLSCVQKLFAQCSTSSAVAAKYSCPFFTTSCQRVPKGTGLCSSLSFSSATGRKAARWRFGPFGRVPQLV